MKLHRNSQKSIYIDGGTYFVTFNTYGRIPYFEDMNYCDLFIYQLKIAKSIHLFSLFGFVIIPDHVHLLLKPSEKSNISKIMFTIKRQFSRNVNVSPPRGFEGAQSLGRLHGRIHGTRHANQHARRFDMTRFKWQKSYHDHYFRNKRDFDNHLRYINTNHLKHGLHDNHQYISYNYPV